MQQSLEGYKSLCDHGSPHEARTRQRQSLVGGWNFRVRRNDSHLLKHPYARHLCFGRGGRHSPRGRKGTAGQFHESGLFSRWLFAVDHSESLRDWSDTDHPSYFVLFHRVARCNEPAQHRERDLHRPSDTIARSKPARILNGWKTAIE